MSHELIGTVKQRILHVSFLELYLCYALDAYSICHCHILQESTENVPNLTDFSLTHMSSIDISPSSLLFRTDEATEWFFVREQKGRRKLIPVVFSFDEVNFSWTFYPNRVRSSVFSKKKSKTFVVQIDDIVGASWKSLTNSTCQLSLYSYPFEQKVWCSGRNYRESRVRRVYTFACIQPGSQSTEEAVREKNKRLVNFLSSAITLLARNELGTILSMFQKCTSVLSEQLVKEQDPAQSYRFPYSGALQNLALSFVCYPDSLPQEIRSVLTAIPKRRVRLYINPFAGKGQGVQMCNAHVLPLLRDSNIECDVVVTKRPLEAQDDMIQSTQKDILQYEGILAAGGDGSLSEVISGIMQRPDWYYIVQNLFLGIVPTGSGNGLAVSLLHSRSLPFSVSNAAWLVAKKRNTRMDLWSTFVDASSDRSRVQAPPTPLSAKQLIDCAVQQTKDRNSLVGESSAHSPKDRALTISSSTSEPERSLSQVTISTEGPKEQSPTDIVTKHNDGRWGERHWAFLSLEWAIVADIDIESETMRHLGEARFDVYGARRGLFLRKYSGRFSYLPSIVHTNVKAQLENQPNPYEEWYQQLDSATAASKIGPCPLPQVRHLVPFDTFPPQAWKTIEGTFTYLWITNTSHQSTKVSTSPFSHHNDGLMTVTLVRDCSRLSMIRILMALDGKGSIANFPGVETFTCSAWRLEPEPRKTAHKLVPMTAATGYGQGHVALDGEKVPYGPIQAELHQGLLKMYG